MKIYLVYWLCCDKNVMTTFDV